LKTKLLLLVTSFLAVISPVKPMIYVAILAIILDTCFGIWRSVKKGGWKAIKSRRLSHVLSKSLLYCGAILFVFLIEKYIAADLLAHFIAVDLVMTKIVAFFCVAVEIKSINEKYEEVTGTNLLKSLRHFVTRAKEEADKLS
jgi:ABC-type antimicrobial peptide transport system permease subunit